MVADQSSLHRGKPGWWRTLPGVPGSRWEMRRALVAPLIFGTEMWINPRARLFPSRELRVLPTQSPPASSTPKGPKALSRAAQLRAQHATLGTDRRIISSVEVPMS